MDLLEKYTLSILLVQIILKHEQSQEPYLLAQSPKTKWRIMWKVTYYQTINNTEIQG
jgi:hypothetical protein